VSLASLRVRLTVLFAVGGGLVGAVAGLLVTTTIQRAVDRSLNDALASRLTAVTTAMRSDDFAVVRADQFSQVVTPDGHIVSDSSGSGRPLVLTDEERARVASVPGIVRFDRDVNGLSKHARLLARNATAANGEALVIAVGTPTDSLLSARARGRFTLLVVSPLIALALGVGAWVLVGATLRPVTQLADEAARLSSDEPGRRLPVPAHDDEVARLARSLNVLLEQVEAALRHQRSFVDDTSHELRTPLSILRGELELARLALDDYTTHTDAKLLDDARASVVSAEEEALWLTRLSEELLGLARLEHREEVLRPSALNVTRLVTDIAARFGDERPYTEVVGSDILVNADAGRLEQVFTNLIANARRYARSRVVVSVRDDPGLGVEVEVADDGPGFPDHLLPVAFERFRRAESARRRGAAPSGGTGLGLAIASRVVMAHGGTISAANGPPLHGAVVTVRLPLDRARVP
jgi:signal transduction histidine kinase